MIVSSAVQVTAMQDVELVQLVLKRLEQKRNVTEQRMVHFQLHFRVQTSQLLPQVI